VEIMKNDIATARDGGADGVVFGCLRADGWIDEATTAKLRTAPGGMDVTFHRAFDVSRDLSSSLETLIQLGIPRVLTSGGHPSVPEGLGVIASLVRQAAGRLSILPGGGVRPENIASIVAATGVQECHLSARHSMESLMTFRRPDIPMGATSVPGEYECTTASVALIRQARGVGR
jgi:copper homeostasis protein